MIQLLARALQDKTRDTDWVGRMGGDEFLLVLPDTDTPGAVKICRRVARHIEKQRDGSREGLPVPTLSYGIAVFPHSGTSADELIRAADQAMYQAKAEGRNRWRLGAGLPEERTKVRAADA